MLSYYRKVSCGSGSPDTERHGELLALWYRARTVVYVSVTALSVWSQAAKAEDRFTIGELQCSGDVVLGYGFGSATHLDNCRITWGKNTPRDGVSDAYDVSVSRNGIDVGLTFFGPIKWRVEAPLARVAEFADPKVLTGSYTGAAASFALLLGGGWLELKRNDIELITTTNSRYGLHLAVGSITVTLVPKKSEPVH